MLALADVLARDASANDAAATDSLAPKPQHFPNESQKYHLAVHAWWPQPGGHV